LRAAFATCLIAIAGTASGQPLGCPATPSGAAIGGVQPWKLDSAVGFTAPRFHVDADGAPDSYRVDDRGLSYLCDGSVGIVNGKAVNPPAPNWNRICLDAWRAARASGDYGRLRIFGMLTGPGNVPAVQQPGDPLPGLAYISTTTLAVPDAPRGTQRRYVNSRTVPFYVLPSRFAQASGIRLGAVAAVYRHRNRALAFAVYADAGPGGQLGEGSIRLHLDLGNDPIIDRSGTPRAKRSISDRVSVIAFPGVNAPATIDTPAWLETIRSRAEAAFRKWGGEDRLRACAEGA